MKKSIQRVQDKHFYSHIIEIDSLIIELKNLKMSEDERLHLISLVEANIHTSIINTILSELDEEDKKIFLHHVANEDHTNIWDLLGQKIADVEDKIKEVTRILKQELYNDIKELTSKSSK